MYKFLLIYKYTQNNEYILKGLFMLEQWQEDTDIKDLKRTVTVLLKIQSMPTGKHTSASN
jgi:hypothetical protein